SKEAHMSSRKNAVPRQKPKLSTTNNQGRNSAAPVAPGVRNPTLPSRVVVVPATPGDVAGLGPAVQSGVTAVNSLRTSVPGLINLGSGASTHLSKMRKAALQAVAART